MLFWNPGAVHSWILGHAQDDNMFDIIFFVSYSNCMGIFGLLSSKGKGKKGAKGKSTPAKINKSAKKKAKTCEFC